MKKRNLLCIFTTSLIIISCSAPLNKESYLEKFDAFISNVSDNYKTYSDKDWEKQAEKYDKFSGEWYEKFKEEFTTKEEITIKANQTKWYYYRNLNAATSKIKQLLESLDVKEIKKQAQYYIDNNMQDDLLKLYEDAQKTGKDTGKTVTDILEELDINIDDLQR